MTLTEKNKQALLVGGILGGAILVILIYFWMVQINPKITNYNKQSDALVSKNKANQEKLSKYKALLADKSKKQKLEADFALIASRLPNNQDPIQIFDILRGYFEGTDVQFTYLEPKAQVNRGRFMEYPFIIRGTARYHEFGQLLNLIECNPERLMRVTAFKFSNNDKRPSLHPMEVGISSFTFNEGN